MGLIAEHTGQPVEQVERDALRDRWFTAEQAKDYGFVDAVLSEIGALTPSRPTASFGTASFGTAFGAAR